jgi:hypothetical protein
MVSVVSRTTQFSMDSELCEETARAFGLEIVGDRAYHPRPDHPNPPAISNTIELQPVPINPNVQVPPSP